MTAYDGLKAALGSYKVVRKFEEKLILGSLHFTDYGRLDFRRYKSARDITLGELARLPDFPCVIVFSDTSVPPIKCRFKRAGVPERGAGGVRMRLGLERQPYTGDRVLS